MPDNLKILLVENDEHDIGLIENELNKAQFHYTLEHTSSRSGFEKLLTENTPSIILSDYNLHYFDGEEAFRINQQLKPEIPFIIISGMLGDEKAVELIKNGVTDYVPKDKLYTLPGKIIRALQESKEKAEKRVAEGRLIENQKKLKEAQLVAKIGNWEVDLLDGSVYWCDQIFHLLGYQPGEVNPSLEFFFSLIPENEKETVKAKFHDSVNLLKPLEYKSHILRKDGSTGYIYASGEIITDNNNKALRVSGMMQDITETKKMEDELKAMNKELETFIYRASHDLRGPLTSIIGLTNLSKAEITDETAKKYFAMVEASAKKLDASLVSLVQSMTLRDMELSVTEFDLDELIREILAQLKFHEGFSDIEISIDNEIRRNYRSNKLILNSIFQNLIQNAVKYQNYHNGKSFLKIKINKKTKGTEFIFEDNGIGIDDNLQPRLFNMYSRGTSSIGGSGLGLYIVKIGVEKLKGNITFKSKLNEGTTFTIFLPDIG
ncbi:MAG: hybrid sensor histidine kinase/response regulator [Bacteroidota bacterium]|nr:hybrid sensor histidine kinase/response regulator [Bacteroidota bacterium]